MMSVSCGTSSPEIQYDSEPLLLLPSQQVKTPLDKLCTRRLDVRKQKNYHAIRELTEENCKIESIEEIANTRRQLEEARLQVQKWKTIAENALAEGKSKCLVALSFHNKMHDVLSEYHKWVALDGSLPPPPGESCLFNDSKTASSEITENVKKQDRKKKEVITNLCETTARLETSGGFLKKRKYGEEDSGSETTDGQQKGSSPAPFVHLDFGEPPDPKKTIVMTEKNKTVQGGSFVSNRTGWIRKQKPFNLYNDDSI